MPNLDDDLDTRQPYSIVVTTPMGQTFHARYQSYRQARQATRKNPIIYTDHDGAEHPVTHFLGQEFYE
jgi:hypothetical protein